MGRCKRALGNAGAGESKREGEERPQADTQRAKKRERERRREGEKERRREGRERTEVCLLLRSLLKFHSRSLSLSLMIQSSAADSAVMNNPILGGSERNPQRQRSGQKDRARALRLPSPAQQRSPLCSLPVHSRLCDIRPAGGERRYASVQRMHCCSRPLHSCSELAALRHTPSLARSVAAVAFPRCFPTASLACNGERTPVVFP